MYNALFMTEYDNRKIFAVNQTIQKKIMYAWLLKKPVCILRCFKIYTTKVSHMRIMQFATYDFHISY